MRPVQVVRATPERAEEALSALLAAGPAASARFARQAEAAKIAIDRMWCLADQYGSYRMAVLAVPTIGRTTMLLASHARSSLEAANLGGAIEAAALGSADTSDIVQALIDPDRTHDLEAFVAGGLQRIATLDYLECPIPRAVGSPFAHPPSNLPPDWTIELACDAAVLASPHAADLPPAVREEIISVLDASYQLTRDCPGLAGMRRTSDVLDGHFGISARPRFWLLAKQHGRALGVCLINTTTELGQRENPAVRASAELVYLGIAPAARGAGIARALLDRGLQECAHARIASLSCAVDATNDPARKLYDSTGFRMTSCREALVRSLSTRRA